VNAKDVITQPAKTGAIFKKNWSLKNIARMRENILSTRKQRLNNR